MYDNSSILKRNYQRVSTNRFVVDSPRFWRKEFHPRFKDIFSYDDIKSVFNDVHKMISYKFDTEYIDLMSFNLYGYFEGYRFIGIPQKDNLLPNQFLNEMYYTLIDILPQISFKDYKLNENDFNLVYNEANTGKEDNSLNNVYEDNSQDSLHETKLDVLSESSHETNNSNITENVDDESWQNNRTINDIFLSPQNQGVIPTNTNRDPTNDLTRPLGVGVSGIPSPDESPFTTNTTKTNFGESNKSQSNSSQQSSEGRERITQNNDDRTTHSSKTIYGSGQVEENKTKKTDDYKESLDFNRGARLQDFFNLNDVRLWKEILIRLSKWILQADIATSEVDYNDCQFYD